MALFVPGGGSVSGACRDAVLIVEEKHEESEESDGACGDRRGGDHCGWRPDGLEHGLQAQLPAALLLDYLN